MSCCLRYFADENCFIKLSVLRRRVEPFLQSLMADGEDQSQISWLENNF